MEEDFMFIHRPKFKSLVKFRIFNKCKNKSKQYSTKVTSRDFIQGVADPTETFQNAILPYEGRYEGRVCMPRKK
jgi:hypothetical protein